MGNQPSAQAFASSSASGSPLQEQQQQEQQQQQQQPSNYHEHQQEQVLDAMATSQQEQAVQGPPHQLISPSEANATNNTPNTPLTDLSLSSGSPPTKPGEDTTNKLTTRNSFDRIKRWFSPSTSSSSPAGSPLVQNALNNSSKPTPQRQPQEQVNGVAESADAMPVPLEVFHQPNGFFGQTKKRIEEFYEVQNRNLGRGHYAVVCQGKCKRTGRLVAIKKIKRFMTDEKRLRAEIAVLKRVKKHPNIVELIDVFETPREVQLVMELCTGGELFERLADKGPYSESDCVRHVKDMAQAVLYLHENGIIHRDLKPENILLSTPNDHDAITKVADFGLARIFTGSNLKTKCGTWGYSAPEMISGSGISFGYDFKVDSWSLGTILYILLCGFHPFDPNGTSPDSEMIASIKNCKFDFEDEAWIGISESAKDLIRHLLVLDPTNRFSMKELLAHEWITGEGSVVPVSPLSPTIHRDLARFRESSLRKKSFEQDHTEHEYDDLDGQ